MDQVSNSPFNLQLQLTSQDSPTIPNPFKIPDIALEIFSHLDLQAIGHSAQVCKSWKKLSEDKKVWESVAQSLGFQDEIKNDHGDIKSQVQLIKQERDEFFKLIQMDKKEFFESINGSYGMDVYEVQILDFCKNKNNPPILAKNCMDPTTINEILKWDTQIQITYAEAFEYVIRKINSFKKGSSFILPNADMMIINLTNIEHKNYTKVRFLDKQNWHYVSWFTVILQVLQDQDIILDWRRLPSDGYLIHT